MLYSLHSLFGMLCGAVFLWLLMGRLNLSRALAFFFSLVLAAPEYVFVAITPIARGNVALMLFVCAALWAICHLNSRRWKWWAVAAALSCFVALGASPCAGILIPLMPLLMYMLKRYEGQKELCFRRLIVPEAVAVATFFFVVFMS